MNPIWLLSMGPKRYPAPVSLLLLQPSPSRGASTATGTAQCHAVVLHTGARQSRSGLAVSPLPQQAPAYAAAAWALLAARQPAAGCRGAVSSATAPRRLLCRRAVAHCTACRPSSSACGSSSAGTACAAARAHASELHRSWTGAASASCRWTSAGLSTHVVTKLLAPSGRACGKARPR